jgi:hypothetical protein
LSSDGESYLCHPADDWCRLGRQRAKAATLTRCCCARRGLAESPRFNSAMPQLTRRRCPDAPDECWHVLLRCGFYPRSHPRELTDGAPRPLRPGLIRTTHEKHNFETSRALNFRAVFLGSPPRLLLGATGTAGLRRFRRSHLKLGRRSDCLRPRVAL